MPQGPFHFPTILLVLLHGAIAISTDTRPWAHRGVLSAERDEWRRAGRTVLEHQAYTTAPSVHTQTALWPSASSIAATQRPTQEWRTFHDVLLRSEDELLYFVSDETTAEQTHKQLPNMDGLLHGQFWNRSLDRAPFKMTVVASTAESKPDACTHWIDQPAIYHSVISIAHMNFAHAVQDGYVELLYTLILSGMFNMSAMKGRHGRLPSSEEADLMILQRQPMFLTAPTAWLLDYLTPDVKAANQMVGACFRTLVVGVDGSPRVYTRALSPDHAQRRQDAYKAFREFTFEAVQSTYKLRGWAAPQLYRRGEGGRTRIGWVSRPPKQFQSRAVLNEAEVIAALKQRYDADISVLSFHSGPQGLGRAIEDTHALDILVGFHGAGLINLLWMEPESVLVQLLPYGWQTSNASFYPNAQLIENVAESAGVRHMIWVNTDPQKAFFLHADFKDKADWVPHPDESTPLPLDKWLHNAAEPYWQYQDTEVDIESFLIAMDDAVQTVGGSHLRHADHRRARHS